MLGGTIWHGIMLFHSEPVPTWPKPAREERETEREEERGRVEEGREGFQASSSRTKIGAEPLFH